ncbi:e6a8727b-b1bd-4078-91ff-bf9a30c9ee5d [Sclerotinia trifoliorum]|uniref:E6a8727b-b1bd-4078-91ff-bf9a30c9ee5d n=1 Tax=Sclerotinia trifoliorum TaxID=28548 RepID=A0A8H2VTE7_9HELO|nr:e6a8727b-b1bd-4078-91ff-bf9a30c9ee5d [Sclerotinia trifoliorum]
MISLLTLLLTTLPIYLVYSSIVGLQKNITAARRSGLPYVISPINLYNPIWLITHPIWLPFIKILPKSWTQSWVDYTTPDWCWQLLYDPFAKTGDTFLVVSPGSVLVFVSNAEAIHQITSRRDAFPKPLKSYRILEIFGRNIITTEGIEWKEHRKISAPSFTEKNNTLVFAESCIQAQGMLRKWLGPDGKGDLTLKEVPTDTMRITLHIISKIGFGVRLLWPGEKPKTKEQESVYSSNEAPEGHTMSFERSLSTLLETLIWILFLPKWLLKLMPFHSAQKALESFDNWGQYMNELFAQKAQEATEGKESEGMDIMGSLVRSSYGPTSVQVASKTSPSRVEKDQAKRVALSDSEILGNAFVMIVAGHETTANSIHFSLMELAINPRFQLQIQEEVQKIFGDSPPETWDYDKNINLLLGGTLGATLNEQLRLMPPVVNIPKSVGQGHDQTIFIDGKKITLPAGANINLNAVGLHRNPRYWPNEPSKITSRDDDLNDFKPERWFTKQVGKDDNAAESSEEDDFGSFTGNNTSASLFRPARGSYIPFSDGARSCLGRRLAQVKIMAVLAVIFQKHSIELAVDEWATDEEVLTMSIDEKKELYSKAQRKARETIRGATSVITLKLHPGFIPVRLMKKGEERFVNVVD